MEYESRDDTQSRYELQLSYYQREKLACRLKVCSTLQLLASGWYAFTANHSSAPRFSLLCTITALLGFSAASGGRRALLQLHLGASAVVVFGAIHLLTRLLDMVLALDVDRQPSTYRLLQSCIALSACLLLLQALIIQFSIALLCSLRRHGEDGLPAEAEAFFFADGVEELLHIDLARTPPRQPSPVGECDSLRLDLKLT